MIKLGVNIDHVATLRQARGEGHPSPAQAALEAKRGGANGITVHLREDRRHIQDADLWEIKRRVQLPLNLEMALHPEIIRIALRLRPGKVCFVPEKRQELTTEGGLDALSKERLLKQAIRKMHQKKIQVSLFLDPSSKQIEVAARAGADAIELHTGTYANSANIGRIRELQRIRKAARLARSLGLRVHAGHGLDYKNVRGIIRIPEIEELNIGFSIVSHAVFVGMRKAVAEMKQLLKTVGGAVSAPVKGGETPPLH